MLIIIIITTIIVIIIIVEVLGNKQDRGRGEGGRQSCGQDWSHGKTSSQVYIM